MKKGKVIIFSAPSGSGKTSIVKYLLENEPGIKFSVSATSRKPRAGEEHGKDYYFISPEEFRRKTDAGDFIEWEEVYEDTYYGTLMSEVENILEKGKNVIFDIDVSGGVNLKKVFGDRALAIFVKPPDVDELRKRLLSRGTEDLSQIDMRIAKAAREMEKAINFDEVIINDKLEEAQSRALSLCRSFIKD